jgi:hypothetical protein
LAGPVANGAVLSFVNRYRGPVSWFTALQVGQNAPGAHILSRWARPMVLATDLDAAYRSDQAIKILKS